MRVPKANDRSYSGQGEIQGHCLRNLRSAQSPRRHDMQDTLTRLFQYKAWADEQLLTALGRLGGESPITALAIKALSHSYIVDRIFAAHLRREAHAYTSANSSE